MRYIGIIILLVLCLTLLLLTGCIVNTVIPETTSGNLENQENTEESVIENTEESVIENTEESVIENTEESVIENTEEPVKWSGLGMGLYYDNESDFDTILTNGFTELRIDIPNYYSTDWLAYSKAAVIVAISKGARVIWGVSSHSQTITAANWATFRTAILSAAQWAQDNGVFEFQLGNEEELHNDDTTLTDAQLIINLKAVATDVQAIFTNGNVSYSCRQNNISEWISVGKGDLDILAANIYRQGWSGPKPWMDDIDNLITAFGVDSTYITEFSLSSVSLDDYSTDEAVQAAALTEMIEYIKVSGMTRALFYCWIDDREYHYGVVKNDGTYRLLWNQALLNSGSVESTTVPIKTTTISLPATIALIPK
jgi:hypothetical protein